MEYLSNNMVKNKNFQPWYCKIVLRMINFHFLCSLCYYICTVLCEINLIY